MASYPHAIQKRISRNHGGPRRSTRAVVLHVDAGGASSLFGWFNNPKSSASSHFYVKYDGTVEQYLDTDLIAWTQRDGNPTCVTIETQGKGIGEWTPAQLASIVALIRWLCGYYGIAKVDMVTSKASARGIGMHRYGIDPWRVSGGEVWGGRGKICPGEDRVRQFPAVVAGVAGGGLVNNPVPPPQGGGETEAQLVARLNAGFSRDHIRWVQTVLKQRGLYLGEVDGYRGPQTVEAIRTFQSRSGLVPDGLPGPLTTARLKGSAPVPAPKPPAPARRTVATDGQWGPDFTDALQELYGTTRDRVISGQTIYAGNRSIHTLQAGSGGSQLVRKMQADMGIAQDGSIGPTFIGTLQARMGTTQDRVISSPSQAVAAMQRAYNDGTLRAKLQRR